MIHGQEARLKLLEGAKEVYVPVGGSYSPKGRLTSIGRPWGFPIVIADGVNIAKEVGSEDLFVDQGIMIIVEAAKKQVEEAGDGTTVTTILAYHLVEKGMRLLEKGVNPMVIRKQIKNVLPDILKELKKLSTPTKGTEDIYKVARISSTDDEIAEIVTKAVEKVGKDGQVTVEENKIPVTEVNYNEGMQIEKGWATPYFVTDVDRMEAVIEDAAVVILGKRITTQLEIVPLLQVLVPKTKNILIIGEVEGEALRLCAHNKQRGVVNIITVPPPASGERRKEFLDDIALVTGASIVTEELGLPEQQFYNQFDEKWIGRAKTVVAKRNQTLIVRADDAGDADAKKRLAEQNKLISEKIQSLRDLRDKTTSIYEREKYEERLAKLTTGVAVIKVGAKAGVDMRERTERVKDAVASAQACQEEGIVPGGGVIFTQLAKILGERALNDGEQLLYGVLQEPTRKLLTNAGESDKHIEEIITDIKRKGGNFGYNVESEKIEDLIKTGIIDPTKVIRLALENSIAVATTMLATDTLITDVPEPNNMQMV